MARFIASFLAVTKIKAKKLIISLVAMLQVNICIAVPYQACFDAASQKYGLPIEILTAIASVESRFNANAKNYNSNKSYDLGLMQVNSIWLTQLNSFGITEKMLFEPCQNVMVGTWILAQKIKAYGFNWTAIQRYNGSDPRLGYAQKVFTAIKTQNPNLVVDNKLTLNTHISPKLDAPKSTNKLPQLISANSSQPTNSKQSKKSTFLFFDE
jgi:hypothetical protein